MTPKRLLPLALLLLAACAGGRFSIGSSTPPGQASEIVVHGARPRIEIRNEGPGELRATFDPPGEADGLEMVLGKVGLVDSLRGPVRVRIEPMGDERVSWRLVAWQSTGLRADLLVPAEE